jgi:hypothetical protein
MNHLFSGIIKIALLETTCGLLVIDRLINHLAKPRYPRVRQTIFAALAALAVFAFVNFGQFHGTGRLVHVWEQYHFYLGAKYQKEVGWFDLYKATLLADRVTVNALARVTQIRDLNTFELVPVEEALQDSFRVRARFSDERWAQFKQDWAMMSRQRANWQQIVQDHGNSNSPAWSLFATPIANLLPFNSLTQRIIGALDFVLMAILWGFIYRTFGTRNASIGLIVASSLPIVFDYLAGSFLRWDWLFAVGMAMCFLKRERHATAGAFFGFAVATKIFPLFFGVALLAKAIIDAARTRCLPRKYLRFGAGALASLALLVVLSSAMFGTPKVWTEYKKRIDVAREEKYYPIQYSLRTVFLQIVESTPGEIVKAWAFPLEIKQARPDVRLADHKTGFLALQLLFTALIFLALVRGDGASAFAMGSLLVFTWLMVNMYYWNMLGLTALGLALRKDRPAFFALLGLCQIPALYYLYQRAQHGFSEAYFVAVLICFWIMGFGLAELAVLRKRGFRSLRNAEPAPLSMLSGASSPHAGN